MLIIMVDPITSGIVVAVISSLIVSKIVKQDIAAAETRQQQAPSYGNSFIPPGIEKKRQGARKAKKCRLAQ